MFDPKFGIEELRLAVRMFNGCNESMNQCYSAEQLLTLYRVYARSNWVFTPDDWTERQRVEALQGIDPTWDPVTEKPTYPKDESTQKVNWNRGAENKYGEVVHTSKCGRYTATRRRWSMPASTVSYLLTGAGGRNGVIDCETLKDAKEQAQEHAIDNPVKTDL